MNNIDIYFSGAVSTANTFIQQNKGTMTPFNLSEECLKVVFQDIVNTGNETLFKAVSFTNPNFKQILDNKYSIVELATIYAAQAVVSFAMKNLHNIKVPQSLPISAEEVWMCNEYISTKSKKVKNSSDNSKIKAKTSEEMEAEASDDPCASGACKL